MRKSVIEFRVAEIGVQRMISPPETDLLCITIIGSLTAREFARL